MHLASQLSGISAVYTYSTGFFREAGIPEAFATHSSAIVGGTMMAVTTVAVPLMGALGTRVLLVAGTVGMLAASIVITVVMNVDVGTVHGMVLITAVSVFCVSFALGPGPVPWIATGDIFGQSDKGAAMASGTFVRWLGSFATVMIFPHVQDNYKAFTFIPSIGVLTIFLVILVALFPDNRESTSKGQEDARLEAGNNKRTASNPYCSRFVKIVKAMASSNRLCFP